MEIWKPIRGLEGYYEVSNEGRVRGLDRKISNPRGHTFMRKGKIISQCTMKRGYKRVYLSKDSKQYNIQVHRAVAEAFIPNPYGLPQVSHINGVKDDNSPDNLEWTSNHDNYLHSLDNGLRPKDVYPKRVGQFSLNGELIQEFFSIRQCSKKLNISDSTIHRVCSGKKESHNGYKLQYL